MSLQYIRKYTWQIYHASYITLGSMTALWPSCFGGYIANNRGSLVKQTTV